MQVKLHFVVRLWLHAQSVKTVLLQAIQEKRGLFSHENFKGMTSLKGGAKELKVTKCMELSISFVILSTIQTSNFWGIPRILQIIYLLCLSLFYMRLTYHN